MAPDIVKAGNNCFFILTQFKGEKKRSPRYRKQKYIPVKINKRNQHLDI